MKMLKNIILNAGLLFLIIVPLPSEGCFWFDESNIVDYFFKPELIDSKYPALHFTFDKFSDYSQFESKYQEDDNINEWRAYWNTPNKDDVKSIVYKSSITDLEKIKNFIQSGSGNIPNKFYNNQAVKKWQQSKDLEGINYLIFAKKCEPHVYYDYTPWGDAPKKDVSKMLNLIEESYTLYNNTKSPFLQLRISFQAIRLAHYAYKYEIAEKIYNEFVKKHKNVKSIIYYWALGHYAGSLQALGKEAKAAYLYSIIFDNCDSKSIQAYRSFRILNDEIWHETLGMCINSREKTTLYFMRAIDPKNNVNAEMLNIYNLDPNSDQLEHLLIREINKAEEETVTPENWKNNPNFDGKLSSYEQKRLQDLQNLCEKAINENKIKNNVLWIDALAYTYYLEGNTQKAIQILSKASTSGNEKLKKQTQLLKLIAELSELKSTAKSASDPIYSKVKQFNDQNLTEFANHVFSRLYKLENNKGAAYLSTNPSFNRNEAILSDYHKILDNQNSSLFEKEILLPKINKNYVYEIQATNAFAKNQFEKAYELYSKITSNSNQKTIPGNPLEGQAFTCLYCARASTMKNAYTRKTLVKKIIDLQNQNNKTASEWMSLGNILYNITYFGTAWDATHYYRSGSGPEAWGTYDLEGDKWTDCSLALEAYKKAIVTAVSEGNEELAAEAAFFASKSYQNMYYTKDGKFEKYGYVNYSDRPYFDQLYKNFQNTSFYRQKLSACEYYSTYISRNY